MSWSKEEALTDPAVREPLMFASEFRFHLRDIPTEIILRDKKGSELTIDTSTQAKPLSQELKLEIPRSFGSSLRSLIVRFADRSPPRVNTPTIKL